MDIFVDLPCPLKSLRQFQRSVSCVYCAMHVLIHRQVIDKPYSTPDLVSEQHLPRFRHSRTALTVHVRCSSESHIASITTKTTKRDTAIATCSDASHP